MIVRKDVSVPRLAILGGLIFILIWHGWSIIVETAVQNVAANPGALRWDADHAPLLDQLVQRELTTPGGDLKIAQEWAQRALASNPLDDRALFFLGSIAERKGDSRSAEALIQIAGARTWRNVAAQLWMYDHEVRHGKFAEALLRVDAVLRVNPTLEEVIFSAVAAFTANPRSFQALTDFLATAPPWREWLLRQLSYRLSSQFRLDQLYSGLKQNGNPPTKMEMRFYLDRLVRDGRYIEAHQAWRETLTTPEQVNEQHLYNADFQAALDGLQFNWVLESVPGANVHIVALNDRQHILRIEFSGARVQFANVKQLMVLPPGNYHFTGRVRADRLRTSRGVWWRLFCAGVSNGSLAQTDLVYGDIPWTNFDISFTVPTIGCKAQWIQLEVPARIASERQIEGQVSYQNLRIAPLLGASTKAN